ncbi:MAG: glycosyltransferase [bacterium]
MWLDEVMEIAKGIISKEPIKGLCHITLGSFRMLPRYDRLGIPYTLGPLGGGECSPLSLLFSRKAPFSHKCSELARPILNSTFALIPSLRKIMKGASMVLATSLETERLLRRMGARHTQVVFPDAYDQPVDVEGIMTLRRNQRDILPKCIRLLWQGRPLWWKAPDLALTALKAALERGIKVHLTMICDWKSPVGLSIKSMAGDLGISSHIDFVGFMSRDELLQTAKEHHAFLATSMHDSGGIPLIEAQAQGLPCLSPALGGNRDAACPDSGVSGSFGNANDFSSQISKVLSRWKSHPEEWLQECEDAVRFSTTFTNERLQNYVRAMIYPCFSSNSDDGLMRFKIQSITTPLSDRS